MAEENSPTARTVKCKVSSGMFSEERVIVIQLPTGEKISTFVDRTLVRATTPGPGQEVSGSVVVNVIEEKGDLAIVDLPQPGLTRGGRVEIPSALLEADR